MENQTQEIKIERKTVYGVEKFYPVCEKAKLLARISGHVTLTRMTLAYIKELGYTITLVHNDQI